MRRLVTGLLVVATALYPVMVYLWVGELSPRIIGGALLMLLLIRLLMAKPMPATGVSRGVVPLLCLFAVGLMLCNRQQMLLWYPVLVNALMLLVFTYTLKSPPSMIERLARITDPNLPAEAIAYTRKVTVAWCLFFTANGLLAAATALWASLSVWTLYNGLIAYLLMGLLFVIELVVRRRVRRGNGHAH